MKLRKRLHLDVLKESARAATRNALESHPPIPDRAKEVLTLGATLGDDTVQFELYVPGGRPIDAVVFTTTQVDRYSGDVLSIQIHEAAWTQFA